LDFLSFYLCLAGTVEQKRTNLDIKRDHVLESQACIGPHLLNTTKQRGTVGSSESSEMVANARIRRFPGQALAPKWFLSGHGAQGLAPYERLRTS